MIRKHNGFTLMELMITVAVIGILAAVAYPSYTSYILRSNRSEAKVGLVQAAQTLERCYTRSNAYNDASCDIYTNSLAAGKSIITPNQRYKITGVVTAAAYVLTATALGPQLKDTKCGNFTLDELNAPNVSGSASAAECWR